MLHKIKTFFCSANPIKKTIIVLWAITFLSGIVFSIFFLAENGLSQTFTSVFGNGITLTTALIFWSIFIFRTLFFIPVSVLMIASPFIFGGFWEGLLMAGIGEIIGATVGFFFARYYGRGFVKHFISNSDILNILDEKMQKFGALSVGLLRLTPVTFDLINFGAGVSKMKFAPYFWATVVSVWPDCMVYVSLAGSVFNPINLIYTVSTIILLILLFGYLKKHPEYREMFVLELKEKTAKMRKKLKSSVSPRKNKKRKKRF